MPHRPFGSEQDPLLPGHVRPDDVQQPTPVDSKPVRGSKVYATDSERIRAAELEPGTPGEVTHIDRNIPDGSFEQPGEPTHEVEFDNGKRKRTIGDLKFPEDITLDPEKK
jgi:hypothetical protein